MKKISKDKILFNKKPNLVNLEKEINNFSWEEVESQMEYSRDGIINLAYNSIDRHVKNGKSDKIALFYRGEDNKNKTYTYKDLLNETNKFANLLKKHGVEKGDNFFLFLPTIPERYISFLGSLKLGAVACTMFSAFQEMALLDRLKDSDAKILITNVELFPRIEKIWDKLPNLKKIIIVERGSTSRAISKNIICYEEEMQLMSNNFEIGDFEKGDLAYMLYTSGSTGKPKGIMHAHGDILQIETTSRLALDIHEDDICWSTADAGWVTGVVYGILGIWLTGATSVIYEGRFSPKDWFSVLQDFKVSVWYTAPTALRMLMASNLKVNDYNLKNLRFIASVGEPLNPSVLWWGMDELGLPIHDTWWQTELGSICISNYQSMDIKPGSMGKPFPGVVAACVDDAGNKLKFELEGNLALKADTIPSFMKKIWKNDKKYDQYFKNGWYFSGDNIKIDKDGYFWFVARADDVIKTAGQRIGPFEVESALIEHPKVAEAGVIGKTDSVRGEIIKAFVVVKDGVSANDMLKNDLTHFVKKRLSGNAYPREIEFIDKLPKTRSGKIVRRILKAKEDGIDQGDISSLE